MAYNKDKLLEIEKAYSVIWNQYIQTTNLRLERVESKINYILAINTFLFFIYLELFKDELLYHEFGFYYIPLLFLGASFVTLFDSMFSKQIVIPWIEKKDFFDSIKKKELHMRITSETYAYITDTLEHSRLKHQLFRYSLYLQASAIISTLILTVSELSSQQITWILILISVIFIVIYIHNKEKQSRAYYQKDNSRFELCFKELQEYAK